MQQNLRRLVFTLDLNPRLQFARLLAQLVFFFARLHGHELFRRPKRDEK